MAIDLDFLKAITEAPSIGTACGPVLRVIENRFGDAYGQHFVQDGFTLFQQGVIAPEKLEVLLVAH